MTKSAYALWSSSLISRAYRLKYSVRWGEELFCFRIFSRHWYFFSSTIRSQTFSQASSVMQGISPNALTTKSSHSSRGTISFILSKYKRLLLRCWRNTLRYSSATPFISPLRSSSNAFFICSCAEPINRSTRNTIRILSIAAKASSSLPSFINPLTK